MLFVIPGHVVFGLCQCCLSLFKRSPHLFLELIDCLHSGFSLVRLEAHLRVLFQLLVDLLSLAVTLQVVGSGCHKLDSEESVELMGEFGNKLRSSVGHDVLWEAMQLPYVSEVESCPPKGSHHCVGRNKVGSLTP